MLTIWLTMSNKEKQILKCRSSRANRISSKEILFNKNCKNKARSIYSLILFSKMILKSHLRISYQSIRSMFRVLGMYNFGLKPN